VEDGDDDLLGGDFSQANNGSQEMSGFESSFPAIDTSNEVSNALRSQPCLYCQEGLRVDTLYAEAYSAPVAIACPWSWGG
jgi:hypothetical protein